MKPNNMQIAFDYASERGRKEIGRDLRKQLVEALYKPCAPAHI